MASDAKDPVKILERVGVEAQREIAEMTDQAMEVLREGLSQEAKGEIPYRDRRAAAEYILNYALPDSPNRQQADGWTLQLFNQDGRSMALFLKTADKLERIPHELKDVTPVDRDPHLIAPEAKTDGEEEPTR